MDFAKKMFVSREELSSIMRMEAKCQKFDWFDNETFIEYLSELIPEFGQEMARRASSWAPGVVMPVLEIVVVHDFTTSSTRMEF